MEPAFAAVEQALDEGLYVAGAFTYELGYHLEPKLKALAPDAERPLFQLGVFKTMTRLSTRDAERFLTARAEPPGFTKSDLHLSLTRDAYDALMVRLHEAIFAGDIYQANLTFPLDFHWPGNVWQLYGLMSPHQKVAFGAVVDMPEIRVASLSPELFFQKHGHTMTCRPMKGTMGRGRTQTEDRALKEALSRDEKNRAENLMIVDLIRNDLGRIACIGSVCVENMFEVETYATLHQMVSTVHAEIRKNLPLIDIFRSLFPCGSVVGAPKIRAMEIISELETTPRGVYTGAIGYCTPKRDMCFSVPIRTVTLTPAHHATLGVGSGVVADSKSADEFDECLLKAQFLKDALAAHQDRPGLIETMRSVDGTIPLLPDHRARLRNSAAALGIRFAEDRLWQDVTHRAEGTTGALRVRLQLGPDGSWNLETAPLEKMTTRPVVIVSPERLRSDDPLLAHKTTRRAVFECARGILDNIDNGFDVLLFNERDELCEGAISNIFLERDGKLVTPALACGLLPGILRAHVIKERGAMQRVLHEDDLHRADKIYLCNAVRGLFEVQLHNHK